MKLSLKSALVVLAPNVLLSGCVDETKHIFKKGPQIKEFYETPEELVQDYLDLIDNGYYKEAYSLTLRGMDSDLSLSKEREYVQRWGSNGERIRVNRKIKSKIRLEEDDTPRIVRMRLGEYFLSKGQIFEPYYGMVFWEVNYAGKEEYVDGKWESWAEVANTAYVVKFIKYQDDRENPMKVISLSEDGIL